MIVLFPFVFALSACKKTCFCTTPALNLDYVAFSPSETDSIILRRYNKNTRFSQLVDTAVLTPQTVQFSYRQDTLSIHTDQEAFTLRSFYDFVFYLPALKRSDSLYNIVEPNDRQEASRNQTCNCINRILSYQLNSDSLSTLVVDPTAPHVYIRK